MEGEKLQTTEERFLLSAMQHGDLKSLWCLVQEILSDTLCLCDKVCGIKRRRRDRAGCDAVAMGKPGNANFRDIFKPISVQDRLSSRHQPDCPPPIPTKSRHSFYENMQEMLQDTDFYQLEELQRRIREAVDALPPAYREAFVMHRFDNKSYKEIAEILRRFFFPLKPSITGSNRR